MEEEKKFDISSLSKSESISLFRRINKYVAQFTMGEQDYQRYHELFSLADKLRIEVLTEKIEAIKPYYAVLNTIYANLYFFIGEDVIIELMKEVEEDMATWERLQSIEKKTFYPKALVKKLLNIHIIFLVAKQMIGLGFPVTKRESIEKQLKRIADVI